ncbi:MAG: methyltransferase domain-containing protein [Muribaculaceae bacterium]|nr:methyltransferase domain-containing protein [Muribaculaceae bacterium]
MNFIDKSSDFRKWLEGIPYEVAFWNSYYANKKRRKDLFQWSMYNKECKLDNFDIHNYIRGLEEVDPKIIDVGSALSFMFGNIINNKKYDVIYLDPLAHFYNKILDRYNIDRPHIEFGTFETLSLFYDENTIDFIHIRNALDHSSDPVSGILNCLFILKKGGILYLNHFVNEGENEGYRGFHQFNLKKENDCFIIWNKDTKINITETLNSFVEIKTELSAAGRLIVIIKKIKDLPETLNDFRRISKDSVKNLFDTIEYFYTLSSSFKYQFKRFYTTLGHKTMRILPYSILNQIKKLAGKS